MQGGRSELAGFEGWVSHVSSKQPCAACQLSNAVVIKTKCHRCTRCLTTVNEKWPQGVSMQPSQIRLGLFSSILHGVTRYSSRCIMTMDQAVLGKRRDRPLVEGAEDGEAGHSFRNTP